MTQGYNAAGKKIRGAAEKSSLVERLGLADGDIGHGYRYADGCHPASAMRQMDALVALVTAKQSGEKGMLLFYPLADQVAMYGVEMYEFGPDGTALRLDRTEVDIGALPTELKPGCPIGDLPFITVEDVAGFTDKPIGIDTAV